MQQLSGNKFSSTDASFLKELFLQRLPGNVRMVLASINSNDLETLASTADKIMEVSTTPVCSVTSSVNIDQLRSEIEELYQLIEKLVSAKPQFRCKLPVALQAPLLLLWAPSSNFPPIQCVGTTNVLVPMLRSVATHVRIRETSKPSISGGKCCWQSFISKPPVLCN